MRGEATYQKHLRRYQRSTRIALESLLAMHKMLEDRCGVERASTWIQGPLANGDSDPMPAVMPGSLAAAVDEVERHWGTVSDDVIGGAA